MKNIKGFVKKHTFKIVSIFTLMGALVLGTVAVVAIKGVRGNKLDDTSEASPNTDNPIRTIPYENNLWESSSTVTVDATTPYYYTLTFQINFRDSEISSGSYQVDRTADFWFDVSYEDKDNELYYMGKPNETPTTAGTTSTHGWSQGYVWTKSFIVGDQNGNSTSSFEGDGSTTINSGSANTTATTIDGLDTDRLYQTNTPAIYIWDPSSTEQNNGGTSKGMTGCDVNVQGCAASGAQTQDSIGTPFYLSDGGGTAANPNPEDTTLRWSFETVSVTNTSVGNISDTSATLNYQITGYSGSTVSGNDWTYRTPQVVQYRVYETVSGVTVIPYSNATILSNFNTSTVITGLSAGTQYTIEFKTDYKYVSSNTVTFKTTGKANNAITNNDMVSDVTTNSAVISYVMTITNTSTVNVDYRVYKSSTSVSDTQGWVDDTQNPTHTDGQLYSIDLTKDTVTNTALESNTQYTVEIRDSSVDTNISTATFTTVAEDPVISNVTATASTPNADGFVDTITINYKLNMGDKSSVVVEYRVYKTVVGPTGATWSNETVTGTPGQDINESYTFNYESVGANTRFLSNVQYTVEIRVQGSSTYTQQTLWTSTVGNSIKTSGVETSSITTTSAVIKYEYNYVDVKDQHIEYRYSSNGGSTWTSWTQDGNGALNTDGYYTIPLTGLTSNTDYQYEIRIKEDTSKVSTGSFTTKAVGPTVAIDNISSTTSSIIVDYTVDLNDYTEANVEYRIYETSTPPTGSSGWVSDGETDLSNTDRTLTISTINGNPLKSNTSYTVEMRSYVGMTYSSTTSRSINTQYETPTLSNLTASPVTGTYNQIELSYTIDLNSATQTTVEYSYSDDNGSTWSNWTKDTNGSITSNGTYKFTFQGDSNTEYDFKLRVNFNTGTSTEYTISNVSTNAQMGAVSNLQVVESSTTSVKFSYNFTQYDSTSTQVQYKIFDSTSSAAIITDWTQVTATPGTNTITTDQVNADTDSSLEQIQPDRTYTIQVSTVENPSVIISQQFQASDVVNITNLRVTNTTQTSATLSFTFTNITSNNATVDYEYQVVEKGSNEIDWAYDSVDVGANSSVTETVTVGTGSTDPIFNTALKSDTDYFFYVYISNSQAPTNSNNSTAFRTSKNYGSISSITSAAVTQDATGTNNDIRINYNLTSNDSEILVYYSLDYYTKGNVNTSTWYVHTAAVEGANTLYIYNLAPGTYNITLWLPDGNSTGNAYLYTVPVVVIS